MVQLLAMILVLAWMYHENILSARGFFIALVVLFILVWF